MATIDISQIIAAIILAASTIFSEWMKSKEPKQPKERKTQKIISRWTIVTCISLILLVANLGVFGWRYWSEPPLPKIEINNPLEGDDVPRSITVKGTISGELPDKQYMWVVVHPHPSMGWWPQTGRIGPFHGEWHIQAWVGLEEDVGDKFDIAVVLVNEGSNQDYENYLEKGKSTGEYPEIPLPKDASTCDLITVTRK